MALGLTASRPVARPLPPPQAASSAVQRLARDIDAVLAGPALARGTWGIVVKSLTTDETLYSQNGRKLLMPASTLKIVTLAAAAERLGWDYTYTTSLVSSAPVRDGVLDGDLFVTANGDPSIDDWDGEATRLFRAWADELKAAGIKTVGGRIVGDGSAFGPDTLGNGWAWDDLDRSYGTAVGALQFNENTARLLVRAAPAAGAPARIAVQQAGTGLKINNRVTTTAAGTAASVVTRRLAGSGLLEVSGSIPVGTRGAGPNVSVVDPATYFLTALRSAWNMSGLAVRGGISTVDADLPAPGADARVLVTHRSASLATLAVTMMKLSQNLYAETLLRSLGAGPATLSAVLKNVESVMSGWGVESTDLVLADGSGLSRDDLVTPEAMLTVLTHVHRDERLRQPFEATLPVAGVDGTMAHRLKGTAAERNVRAKTGSFTNARAIAGYLVDADGEPLAFTIIANNFGVPGTVIEKAEDAVLLRLVQFSRR